MNKGQMIELLKDVKVQNKSFKAGIKMVVDMAATNHDKENHIFVVCKSNGEPKKKTNPKNFVGINQKQIDFGIEHGTLRII